MHPQLRKTAMCKFHLIGVCNKGAQCAYAHDSSEIQERPDFSCTKLCKNLINSGYCHLYPRCKFAHSKKELQTEVFSEFCRDWMQGRCLNGARCRFSHGEEDPKRRSPKPEGPGSKQKRDRAKPMPGHQQPAPISQSGIITANRPQHVQDQPLSHQRACPSAAPVEPMMEQLQFLEQLRSAPQQVVAPPHPQTKTVVPPKMAVGAPTKAVGPPTKAVGVPSSPVGAPPGLTLFAGLDDPHGLSDEIKPRTPASMNSPASNGAAKPNSLLCPHLVTTGRCDEVGCPFSHRFPTPDAMAAMLMGLEPDFSEDIPRNASRKASKTKEEVLPSSPISATLQEKSQDTDDNEFLLNWTEGSMHPMKVDVLHSRYGGCGSFQDASHALAFNRAPGSLMKTGLVDKSLAASTHSLPSTTASDPRSDAKGCNITGAESTASSEDSWLSPQRIGAVQDPVMMNQVVMQSLKDLLEESLNQVHEGLF